MVRAALTWNKSTISSALKFLIWSNISLFCLLYSPSSFALNSIDYYPLEVGQQRIYTNNTNDYRQLVVGTQIVHSQTTFIIEDSHWYFLV